VPMISKMRKRKKRIIVFAVIIFALTLWTIWGNVTVGVTYYSIKSLLCPIYTMPSLAKVMV